MWIKEYSLPREVIEVADGDLSSSLKVALVCSVLVLCFWLLLVGFEAIDQVETHAR